MDAVNQQFTQLGTSPQSAEVQSPATVKSNRVVQSSLSTQLSESQSPAELKNPQQLQKEPITFDSLPPVTREQAVAFIFTKPAGSYILRQSSDLGSLAITMRTEEGVLQFRCANSAHPGTFLYGDEEKTLADIVQDLGPEFHVSYVPTRFHQVDKDQAERLLEFKPPNTFLLRPSSQGPHILVISVKTDTGVKHVPFPENDDETYQDGFNNVTEEQLIEKYGKNNLFTPEMQANQIQKVLQKVFSVATLLGRIYAGEQKGAAVIAKLYLAEVIDTKHRYGQDLNSLFTIWKGVKTADSFNEWLGKLEQGEHVPGKIMINSKYLVEGKLIGISMVRYLTEEERASYEIRIDDKGKVADNAGKPLTTGPGQTHIFVISWDKRIFVGEHERGKFHHSSFFAGGSVRCAGKMVFKGGKLTRLTDKCGHYPTTPQMMGLALDALDYKGVDLKGTALILYDYPGANKPMEYHSVTVYNKNRKEKKQ